MNYKGPARRRGNIVVLSAFLIVAMLAMAAFAVDLGYIADAKNELQRSADAGALAAAARLPNTSQAVAAAMNCTNNNKTSITPALKAQDIVFGFWDRDTATFHNPRPSGRPYNSVKITLRRTTANGNPLNLFFGRVLGKHSADVTATAIAYGDRGLCGPFIGVQEVTASDDVTTDSYDSYDGSYVASQARARGSLCSDGSITVGGDANVLGDVRAGADETVTIHGSSSSTSGQIGNRITALNLTSVDPGSAATINNNATLVTYLDPGGGGWLNPLNPISRNFTLTSGANYTIPPGTYYFNDMTLPSGSTLNINGATTIYLTGNFNRHSGAAINNTTQLASNLRILMTGGTAEISNGNEFYGVIYGPGTDITYSGTADYFGALVGRNLTICGDATAHYDESLDINLGAYALRVMLVD
jgi:Flp pilus assembly protein TadG